MANTVATISEAVIRTKDIQPIILAFASLARKYLNVSGIFNGGKAMLNAYIPICAHAPVPIGFSLSFIPHVGQ